MKFFKKGFAPSFLSASLGILVATIVITGKQKSAGKEALQQSSAFQAPVALAGSDPVLIQPNIFVDLAKKVVPSVVNISSSTAVKVNPYRNDEMFRRFFEEYLGRQGGMPAPEEEEGSGGRGGPGRAPRAISLGSGFIISSDGLILTNNHVIQGADEIKINFTEKADEEPSDAEVVGRDPELDLAILRVKKKDFTFVPLSFGDSDALQVGEYVAAVGNPFGQGHSLTHGIISAKDRKSPDYAFGRYLQTDAPINPGNSGGPLVNLKGEVIGINNAIDARAHGIGFAIPSNLAKQVIPQLKSKGSVTRGYIGVLVNELTKEIASQLKVPKEIKSPFVAHVYPGQPADQAGLKPYDVILSFGEKKVLSAGDLIEAVTATPVNQSVNVKIFRQGKEKELSLKVAERPDLARAQKELRKQSKKKEKSTLEFGADLEDLTTETARELSLSKNTKGAVVLSVQQDTPAARAGLLTGDVIVEVNQKAVQSVDQLNAQINSKKAYMLRVRRQDQHAQEVFVVLVLDLK